ncbi:MAG TPA: baseplate J/gp47 family protein [Xanthobacteraceae bacterium]|nr:baseplate J/gp47 family protein [Xanthobacteraceae bacterium]
MITAPTTIDLSRVPPPNAIEPLDYEALFAAFVSRFKAAWERMRAVDPTLPAYDVEMLETDPAMITGEAWSYLRLRDRARVNDAVRAVLAPLARGTNLDNVAARVNIERLVVIPATANSPAVMESDTQLLRRYLMAFDRPSAGSRDRYLFEAFSAWPGMLDAAVIGRAVHGRRGDTDIVIIGPGGALPTTEQVRAVRDAVTATDVKPEATAVTVIPAVRTTYSVSLVLTLPQGPDPSVVIVDARARVDAAIAQRTLIGAEAPVWAIAGAAYGDNVIRVRVIAPEADIPADPYAVPVCTGVTITAEVQG